MKHTHFTITEVKKLPESLVSISGEISAELLSTERAHVLKKIQSETALPGFRKGHVPEHILIEKMGAMNILQDAAESALGVVYADMLESAKIFPIGNPEVAITKLADDNPLGFVITVAVLPEFKLPNYKKIAEKEMKKTEEVSVDDKEVNDVIAEIQKKFAKDAVVPEFNDEFVKSIGGNFENVEDFKIKAKENIQKDKEHKLKEKKRNAILEDILKETEIIVPKVIVESELQKMLLQFEDDIKRAGATMEDYLKHVKKTKEDIQKEWMPTAEKKAKMQLILNKISEEEKILPDNDKVRSETEKIMILHPDADPMKARMYVAQMFLNEEVMQFLEKVK